MESEEKEDYPLLDYVKSQRLSTYCKPIKNALIGVGTVEEEKFIRYMVSTLYQEWKEKQTPSSQEEEDRTKQVIYENVLSGINFLVSIHCVQRKMFESTRTLFWYGIQGIAQSVVDFTNEEHEMRNELIYKQIEEAKKTKRRLEEAIQNEQQMGSVKEKSLPEYQHYVIVTDKESDVYYEITHDSRNVYLSSKTPFDMYSEKEILDLFQQ